METFRCKVTRNSEWPGKLETQNGLSLEFSKPPEYNGTQGTITPEDAFVSALITCLACTFDSYSNKMRLKVLSYESDGIGTVDRVDEIQRFTSVLVNVRIVIPAGTNKESVLKAIDRARENCLVAASLSTPVKYNVEISVQ